MRGRCGASLTVALALCLSACTGGRSAPSSTAPTEAPIAPSSATPTAPGATASAPATPAGPRDCATSDLTVSTSGTGAGAGHSGLVIVFANRGPTCVMRAYPGVDGVDASGRSVVHATRTPRGYLGGAEPAVVTLRTGATASALLEGSTGRVGSAPCPQYVALLITPPNETHSVTRPVRGALCQPTVHPVVAGSRGGSSSQG